MNKKEIKEAILKEKYKTLSILEDEVPRKSQSKIAKKIDKMMRETLRELADLSEI